LIRHDLSDRLIHLTRGHTPAGNRVEKVIRDREAMANFCSIMRSAQLHGGTGNIVGGHRCVCFSEAPIASLAHMLAPGTNKYAPLGVMVDKTWLFAQGGRPVIYQPVAEYEELPETHKYRHVNYDPINATGDEQDVSWEREWRVETDSIALDPALVTLVVPYRSILETFKGQHDNRQRYSVWATGEVAASSVESFPWHFLVLQDLGLEIDFG